MSWPKVSAALLLLSITIGCAPPSAPSPVNEPAPDTSSSREAPSSSSAPVVDAVGLERARCRAHWLGAACWNDRACVMSGVSSNSAGIELPERCERCVDWVALTGRVSPIYCTLRAAGQMRSACEIRSLAPKRCKTLENEDAGAGD